MPRVLRDISLADRPVALPGPGSWDSSTQAIYDQGREAGHVDGYAAGWTAGMAAGRDELRAIEGSLSAAAASCVAEIRATHRALVERIVDLAELYSATVARRLPDPSARGLLERVGEALTALEPAPLELAVPGPDVDAVRHLLAGTDDEELLTVVAGHDLGPGEYRLRGDHAEVDGTWERYLDAAREAIGAYLIDQAEADRAEDPSR